jgi:hypothetical protein
MMDWLFGHVVVMRGSIMLAVCGGASIGVWVGIIACGK